MSDGVEIINQLKVECERLRKERDAEHKELIRWMAQTSEWCENWNKERDRLRAERDKLRNALERISNLVETGQGCSINNHEIAVICLDIL